MKRDLAIAIALALATVFFCWPTLQPFAPTLRNDLERGMIYSCDEYTVLYEADQMSRGFVPYRDFFDFKGPIGFLPFALAFKIGTPGVVNGRIAMFCVMAILAALFFAVARRLGAGRVLGAALGLLVPLVIWPCWSYAYQDFLGQVLLLGAAWFALGPHDTRARDQVACGVLVALAAWTTLAQGVTAAVTLPLAAVMLAREEKRSWRPMAARFMIGFFATSALIVGALAALGALPEALRDIFVFPFATYPKANRTRYAFDVPSRISRWKDAPLAFRASLSLVIYAVVTLPLVALAIALVAGGWRTARLVLGRAATPSPFARRVLVAAALAAPFIPVAISKTRSDVCHIGFVLATTLLVLVALASAPAPRARVLSAARLGLGVLVALLLIASSIIWASHRVAKYERLPLAQIEPRIAKIWGADVLAAMTDRGDPIYVAPLGGLHYLLSRRDNATTYNLLTSSVYSAEQWPIAAAQLVERKPRMIHTLSPHYFQRLLKHRPELAQLYAGSGNHYVLRGRRGPTLELPTNFSGRVGSNEVTLTLDQADSGRINGGPSRRLLLDGDAVTVFADGETWVARLSSDGRRLKGETFPGRTKLALVRGD